MTSSHRILPDYIGPRLFGAPVGDFSLFQTVLLTFAVGFASFFLGTFAGIIGMVVASVAKHRMLDYSIAYRWVGLPIGIGMLVFTGLYLGALLIRRVTRGN